MAHTSDNEELQENYMKNILGVEEDDEQVDEQTSYSGKFEIENAFFNGFSVQVRIPDDDTYHRVLTKFGGHPNYTEGDNYRINIQDNVVVVDSQEMSKEAARRDIGSIIDSIIETGEFPA